MRWTTFLSESMVTQPLEEIFELVGKEDENFKRSIGNLVMQMSDFEGALFAVLRHYAGVSHDVARSLFSGSRARTMMDFIDNIAHNTGMSEGRRADLSEVFTHVKALCTMRDRIIHYVDGSEIRFEPHDPKRRYLSNKKRVNRTGKEFRVSIGAEDVDALAADLHDCCWQVLAHRDSKPFKPWAGPSGVPYSWLYKPLQPAEPFPTSPKKQLRKSKVLSEE